MYYQVSWGCPHHSEPAVLDLQGGTPIASVYQRRVTMRFSHVSADALHSTEAVAVSIPRSHGTCAAAPLCPSTGPAGQRGHLQCSLDAYLLL